MRQSGRFHFVSLQEDTYRGNKNDPLSLNLYTYCSNNPLIYWDYTGHWQSSDSKLTQTARIQISRLTDAWYAAKPSERASIEKAAKDIRNNPNNIAKTTQSSVTATAYNKQVANNGGADLTAEQWNKISTTKTDKVVTSAISDGKITQSEVNIIATSKPSNVVTKPIVNNPTSKNTISSIGYDRDAAVAYANNPNYNDGNQKTKEYNTAYDRFDTTMGFITSLGRERGDCANFVSQSLVAGNLKMNNDWHYYKGIPTVVFLPSVTSSPLIKEGEHDMTAAWAQANAQFKYFADSSNGYSETTPIEISSSSQVSNIANNGGVQKGDLLYWDWTNDGMIEHATIISGVENGHIYFSGHTNDRVSYDLSTGIDKTKEDSSKKNVYLYIVKIK